MVKSKRAATKSKPAKPMLSPPASPVATPQPFIVKQSPPRAQSISSEDDLPPLHKMRAADQHPITSFFSKSPAKEEKKEQVMQKQEKKKEKKQASTIKKMAQEAKKKSPIRKSGRKEQQKEKEAEEEKNREPEPIARASAKPPSAKPISKPIDEQMHTSVKEKSKAAPLSTTRKRKSKVEQLKAYTLAQPK